MYVHLHTWSPAEVHSIAGTLLSVTEKQQQHSLTAMTFHSAMFRLIPLATAAALLLSRSLIRVASTALQVRALHHLYTAHWLVSVLSLSLFTDTNTPFVLVHFQHGFPFSLLGSDIGLLLQTTTTTTYYHTATTTVCNGCQCCFNLPTTTLKHICQLPLMCCSVCWILTVNTR